MTIDTELVKNKRFHAPAESEIKKHSQEYRALATMRYLYPMKYDSLSIGEAPDLQDSKNSLGIEVTVAVKEKDMEASSAFAELRHGNPENAEKNIRIIESTGYKFIPFFGDKPSIVATGTSDGEKKIVSFKQ